MFEDTSKSISSLLCIINFKREKNCMKMDKLGGENMFLLKGSLSLWLQTQAGKLSQSACFPDIIQFNCESFYVD